MAVQGQSGPSDDPIALRILVAVLDPTLRDALVRELDRELPVVPEVVEDLGQAAALLVDSRYDAVIADAALPDFEDPMLLRLARDTQPDAVRIALVGDDRRRASLALLAHVAVAHSELPGGVADVVRRAVSLHRAIEDPIVRAQVAQCTALPSTPTLYAELVGVLSEDDDAVEVTAEVVSQDPEIAARVLQLTNSAFMGRSQPTSDLTSAIAWLGLASVRGLVLSLEVVRTVRRAAPSVIDMVERLQAHAMDVAMTARVVAPRDGDAYSAGLLHDIGKLVLLANDTERWHRVLARIQGGQTSREAEMAEFGCAHDDIGAAMLAQWGLPRRLIEAVAAHHRPDLLEEGFGLSGIVHVANALAYDQAIDEHLDAEYVEAVGIAGQIPQWRQALAPIG